MNLLTPFLDFDQKMLDVLESLCHRQQRLFGTSHYFWLKLFAMVHAVVAFIFFLPVAPPAEHYKSWLIVGSLLCCIPGFTWWERRSLNRIMKGLSNPLRKSGRAMFCRYVVGYVSTSWIIIGITTATVIRLDMIWISTAFVFWWATLASLYVLPACDPLPPVAGKWKELLSKVFLKPVLS